VTPSIVDTSVEQDGCSISVSVFAASIAVIGASSGLFAPTSISISPDRPRRAE
jgi:hypothetical protein